MTLPILRPYQSELVGQVDAEWMHGARNVLMRLATGGGKSVILAYIVARHPGCSCVIVHRNELVVQLSLALAKAGVRHNIIAARATRQAIVAAHMLELGQSWFDPGARAAVASVDTLVRAKGLEHWFAQVTLWVTDEGHHLVLDNKWHTATDLFTNPACRGLLPTATPERADGTGLGRASDGVADAMVEGPPERWLIDEGYLTDYRIVMAESDLAGILESERVAASGDYSIATQRKAARQSHIVGDVVRDYLSWAPGKLWITFTSDVETATEIAAAYNAAGVRAEVLTGDVPYAIRRATLQRFERREILQLVVVDIVSEGFDLPAVEGASSARKTESLATYRQQFGRVLRPMYAPGYDLTTRDGRLAAIANGPKPRAWWIDHVNNVGRHRAPDMPRVWTLDRRGARKGGGGDGIPLRTCLRVEPTPCAQPYERFRTECPYCGEPAPAPASRSSPEAVEGDLVELDEAALLALRTAVAAVDMSPEDYRVHLLQSHAPSIGVMAGVNRHAEKQIAQAELRAAMVTWCGEAAVRGLSDREVQRLWWLTWGVDILSARALGRVEAEALTARLTQSKGLTGASRSGIGGA
jgi:superfamily II DNA or RNA helicase